MCSPLNTVTRVRFQSFAACVGRVPSLVLVLTPRVFPEFSGFSFLPASKNSKPNLTWKTVDEEPPMEVPLLMLS